MSLVLLGHGFCSLSWTPSTREQGSQITLRCWASSVSEATAFSASLSFSSSACKLHADLWAWKGDTYSISTRANSGKRLPHPVLYSPWSPVALPRVKSYRAAVRYLDAKCKALLLLMQLPQEDGISHQKQHETQLKLLALQGQCWQKTWVGDNSRGQQNVWV